MEKECHRLNVCHFKDHLLVLKNMYVKKDVFTVPDANFGKFLYLVP